MSKWSNFWEDVHDAATKQFTRGKVGSASAGCRLVRVRLEELTFQSNVSVAHKNRPVPTPHWRRGLNVNDPNACSRRAAVYRVRGAPGAVAQVQLRVRVIRSRGLAGSGMLLGSLGANLSIEGQCPLAQGTHTVNARIYETNSNQLPDSIQWCKGDMDWRLHVPDMNKNISLGTTRLEVFFVLQRPRVGIYPNGVWVEALRLLCQSANVINVNNANLAAERVTRYCHTTHGMSYDHFWGMPRYGVTHIGGVFDLKRYLAKASPQVNCYDQAAALQSLCDALGVNLVWVFMNPFGYINDTDLVRCNPCNNPFWRSPGVTNRPQVAWNDANRSAFGNHAFCRRGAASTLDACAGPHTGNETPNQYVTASIDARRAGYGGVGNMNDQGGVTGVN